MAETVEGMKIKCSPEGVVAAAEKDADRRAAVMAHELPGVWYMVADADHCCGGYGCYSDEAEARNALLECEALEPDATWAIFKMSLIKPLVVDVEPDEVEAKRLHDSALSAMSPKLETQ